MLFIHKLKKSFNEVEVLKDINFSLEKGKIYVLLGKNGAGKTTIINCILKLLKADSGAILLDGKDIYSIKNKEYFSKVTCLLESSDNVYDNLTGIENIRYFAGLNKISIHKNEKFDEYVDKLSMREHLNKKVGQYSKGMKQKLAIIIALLPNPDLILLDEPTLGLDLFSKKNIIDFLTDLSEVRGKTILVTTHQVDVIEKLRSEILLLSKGIVFPLDNKKKLNKNEYTYLIKYVDESVFYEDVKSGELKNIILEYENKNVLEIKKKSMDIEDIIMEGLNEVTQNRTY